MSRTRDAPGPRVDRPPRETGVRPAGPGRGEAGKRPGAGTGGPEEDAAVGHESPRRLPEEHPGELPPPPARDPLTAPPCPWQAVNGPGRAPGHHGHVGC
ncbi:hypothetical protein ACFQ3Z_07245 [Streptomyces nogalater]